ncbi:MAG: vanadium-dependent haloperoxidase [Prosthecobacter sp.]|nr:vanadium-dependent haloperoxidase [Prosthecobacter sp.]
MKQNVHFRLRLLAAACLLVAGWQGHARADLISDWNAQAMAAIRDADLLSPESTRDLAMLHTAIYNAVEGIAGDYNLFSNGSYTGPSGAAADGASMEAAVAAAANTIMQSLHPGLAGDFTTLYTSQLGGIADSQAKTDGINFGTLVANDILNWRATDGSATASDPGLYTPQFGQPGHWQPVPPTFSSDPDLPGWGGVTTFAINGTGGFTGSLPGASTVDYLSSAQYATDYNQVKELGSAASGTRTVDQLNAAYFWAAGTGTVTTAGMWNEVAQSVAASAGLSLQDTARLFAALNVAMADSAIVAWETKYAVDFWSPVIAIVNGATDGNAATDEDAAWQSLLTETPNHPSFLSDTSAISAAAAAILKAYLGDDFAFTAGSDIDGDGTDDMLRNFSTFSDAAAEAGMSQIYGGVNFGTSDTDGQTAGTEVADYILDNNFAPVPEPAGALLVLWGAGMLAIRRRRP